MNLEPNDLMLFARVVDAGSFSRAAERCHVWQPSLSQQIQKLEAELGERLFDRLQRQVRLTPAGELFLPRAIRILEEVDAARREAAEAKLFASQTANFCADECLQIHGGAGYTDHFIVERLFRDARITEIYEGATDIQRLVIARSLLA